MHKKKPIIAMDLSSTGKGGGPYTSTKNLINSSLKEDYDFQLFTYKTELGRFISIKRIKDIVRQLDEIKPDIVHFTGLQLSGFHIAVACRVANIRKTIVVIRGSSTEAMNIGKFKRIIIYFLESITLAITSTFYGVSLFSSRISLTKPFQKKSSGFVYNLPLIAAKSQTHFVRKDFGFADDDVIIVSVARIVKDKGYHILTQSIKDFTNSPKIKFLIIGTGDYLQTMKMELLTQEQLGQVVFLGYRDDVPDLLALCDIFVLPTLHETLSNSLLEASYYKLPLIASNVGGVPEIIKNGENGILVQAANSVALSQAMRILAENSEIRKKMGEKAKQRIEIKFSEESITARIKYIYQTLLDKE